MILGVFRLRNRPQRPLANRWPAGRLGHGQDVLLDLGDQAQESQDLGDAGSGDALAAGDLGLVADLARVELAPPLDGLAQELGDPGRPGLPGRLGLDPARRDGADDPVGAHTAREGADVAVIERPFGAQRDLDRLFAVGGPGFAVAAIPGDV